MSSRVIIVVLGKQGAGKGTQCKRLAQHLSIPHVSTGDILRAAVRDKTAIGLEVSSILDAGQLVSDDLVNRLVAERFTEADAQRGALIDGYPRTDAQAEALDDILGDDGVKICINLDVPNSLVTERLSSRRVCQECGNIYRDTDPEAISGTCSNCGGDVIQRADDLPEAIAHRLEAYERDTAPLLKFYDQRGLLVRVDGDQDLDAVTAEILRVLSERGLAARRSAEELNKMRKAGKVVAEMHEVTRAALRPGVTTMQLNELAAEVIAKRGARSTFLNYHGFPAVICTSPNDMVVHGIPGDYVLAEGDIISVDCGAIIEGYHGDAAYTAGVGEISDLARRLLEVTERSMWAGIEQLRIGNRLHEVGRAVQNVAEAAGFSVVREYVGHAIGTAMHETPQVPNYWPGNPGPTLKEGMVFAVEPMVNVGTYDTYVLDDGWGVMTQDGKLSAHFEHTIAVTDDGPEVFTV